MRQLDQQIAAEFYQRTLLSKNKVAMLHGAAVRRLEDLVTPEEEIKDSYVLEFLGLILCAQKDTAVAHLAGPDGVYWVV